jgi:hypothetical protein
MKTFTRADVLKWQQCHTVNLIVGIKMSREETVTMALNTIRGLPQQMTALDVLRHESRTHADRLWCALRSKCLDARTLRIFAENCARHTLAHERDYGREPDPRSWAAVDAAKRHAEGMADDGELMRAAESAKGAFDEFTLNDPGHLAAFAAWKATDCHPDISAHMAAFTAAQHAIHNSHRHDGDMFDISPRYAAAKAHAAEYRRQVAQLIGIIECNSPYREGTK